MSLDAGKLNGAAEIGYDSSLGCSFVQRRCSEDLALEGQIHVHEEMDGSRTESYILLVRSNAERGLLCLANIVSASKVAGVVAEAKHFAVAAVAGGRGAEPREDLR